MTMNRAAYEKLIAEDIEWLLRQPRTLEREHIEAVLRAAAAAMPLLDQPRKGITMMLFWAAVFFIFALIAAVLGFGGIAAGVAGIKILFFIFLVAFVVSLLIGVFRPR